MEQKSKVQIKWKDKKSKSNTPMGKTQEETLENIAVRRTEAKGITRYITEDIAKQTGKDKREDKDYIQTH